MISFTGLLIVGVVAVAVPLLLGLVPAVKLPAVVLEILGGILVGPAVLGWVHLDVAVQVVSDLGLGFLLFMAGYEIDLRRFDRPVLALVARAFAASRSSSWQPSFLQRHAVVRSMPRCFAKMVSVYIQRELPLQTLQGMAQGLGTILGGTKRVFPWPDY